MDTQHTPRFLSKDEASVLAICAFPTVFARFTGTAIGGAKRLGGNRLRPPELSQTLRHDSTTRCVNVE